MKVKRVHFANGRQLVYDRRTQTKRVMKDSSVNALIQARLMIAFTYKLNMIVAVLKKDSNSLLLTTDAYGTREELREAIDIIGKDGYYVYYNDSEQKEITQLKP